MDSAPQSCLCVQVAVMHAFIDLESFPGVTLDQALRALLSRFRLPGKSHMATPACTL